MSYSHEKSSTATAIFIDYLLFSLHNYGINPETITIQTDNGKEFTNPHSQKLTLFEKIVTEKYKARHKLIPYQRPTYNSDVESFHNLIEEEFFISEKQIMKQNSWLKLFPIKYGLTPIEPIGVEIIKILNKSIKQN